MCLIMDAGSAGVSPATPKARLGYHQTTLLVSPEPAESADLSDFTSLVNNHFGLIKGALMSMLKDLGIDREDF